MKRTIECGVVISSLLAGLIGCASDADLADVDDPPSAASDPATAATPGDTSAASASSTSMQGLPPPQIAYSGGSRVLLLPGVAPSSAGSVQITGDPSDGAFALVRYSVAVSGNRATAQFTVDPAPGASFIYDLHGSGSGYSTRTLRLERVPGSNQLYATTATGKVACGPIAAATSVTLVYDGDHRTFDVQIGGSPGACTRLSTRMKPPAVGFQLMDASNAGYGGVVTFSQLALF